MEVLEAHRLDQIGEAYIYALGLFRAEAPAVTLFGRQVASHEEAILALHDELERQGVTPEGLLRVMKHKARTASPL